MHSFVFQMKYCSLQSQCEMKFAHVRFSEYFTFAEQIFHSEAISLARRANFVEKALKRCVGVGKNAKKMHNFSPLYDR